MAAYDVAPTQPAERRTTLPCSYQMCQAVAVAKGLAWARVLSLEARRPRHCLTHERTPGGISSSIDLGGSRVSLADVLWVLPVLVGVALGWSMRSRSVLALLLGAALVVVSFVLFGYSIDPLREWRLSGWSAVSNRRTHHRVRRARRLPDRSAAHHRLVRRHGVELLVRVAQVA